MARGHLPRSPSGHLIRQAGRSPDAARHGTYEDPNGPLTRFMVLRSTSAMATESMLLTASR